MQPIQFCLLKMKKDDYKLLKSFHPNPNRPGKQSEEVGRGSFQEMCELSRMLQDKYIESCKEVSA